MRRVVAFAVVTLAASAAVFAQNLFAIHLTALSLALPGIDKALHFAEYLVITIALYEAAKRLLAVDRALPAALMAAVALSMADEGFQALVPARNVDARDLLVNWSGIAIGALLVAPARNRMRVAIAASAIAIASWATYDSHLQLREYAIGMQHERREEFTLARDAYRRAIAGGLRLAGLYNGLAWTEVESGTGDATAAVAYAEAALRIQPKNADFMDTYGWALFHAGRHHDALAALRRAYEAKPAIRCIHYHLGVAYAARGEPLLAAAHFRQQLLVAGARENKLADRALQALPTSVAMMQSGVRVVQEDR